MAGFSDFLENELLDHIFNGSAYSTPAKYIALYTAPPTDAGGGTEVSGNGYARKQCSSWSVASGGSCSNSAAVQFDQASGAWGTVTHFGIFDSLSGGNLLGWGAIGTPRAIVATDVYNFAIGSLVITLD